MSSVRAELEAWIEAAPTPHGDHFAGHGSEIERQLAYRLLKYRNQGTWGDLPVVPPTPDTALAAQAPLHTSATTFYGDLVLMRGGRVVLIECDGAAFHRDQFRDDVRLALILAAGLVDDIFRFRGTMLTHGPEDAAYLMQQVLPADFFSEVSPIVLPSLIHRETQVAGQQLVQAGAPFSLNYEAEVETAGYDEHDSPNRRTAEFQFVYMTAAAPTPTVATITAALASAQPTTMDRALYLAEQALAQEDR